MLDNEVNWSGIQSSFASSLLHEVDIITPALISVQPHTNTHHLKFYQIGHSTYDSFLPSCPSAHSLLSI